MKKLMMIIFSVVMLSGFIFSEYYPAEEPEKFEAKYYENARVIRVKHSQGEAYIKRSYEEGIEEATTNLPVFENDTAGTTDGRLELYLGKLNYLRLDYDSEVTFETVPELRTTHATIRLLQGGIYLDINRLDEERDIEIQTSDCGVFILEPGQYRINVNRGVTEVFVHNGQVDVAGSEFERIVRENQKIVMRNGDVRERPFYFSSSEWDDFDSWHNDRAKDTGYARYTNSRYLNEGYEDYEYELSRNGRWRYSSNFNTYIWIPYNIGSSWRPYYHGRWVWNPHYGNVWSSYDNWGWYTHHYGRWHWDVGFGWHWIPGYRWSPAWVSWFWDDHYYGWSPLSWWNRPIVIYNNHWHRHYRYRHGVPYRSWSTIIIKKNNLYVGNVGRHIIHKSTRARLAKNRLKFRGGSPTLRPSYKKVNVINARGKRMVFKKNGLVTTSKYKVLKKGSVPAKLKTNGSTFQYSGRRLSKLSKAKYSRPVATNGKTLQRRTTSRYTIKKSPRSGSSYSTRKSSTPYKFTPKKTKSSTKSSSTGKRIYKKPKSKTYGKSKSTSKKIKVKKRKDSPSYSFNYSPRRDSYSSPSNSTSYTSRKSRTTTKKRYTSTYKPKNNRDKSSSYSSPYKKSYKSTYRNSTSKKSYSTPSHKYRSSSYKSSKSYSSPSYTPSRSYKKSTSSSYKSSKSYSSSKSSSSRSYRKSSSGSSSYKSSRSYSSPKTTSRRSYTKSSSSSRGSRSSSGRSYKKK